jgi:sulfite exporter TauE/SafE
VLELSLLLAALGGGLVGSGHCLGMCGGIVGAFALGVAPERRQRVGGLTLYVGGYQLGRLLTYALLGAVAGAAGAALGRLLPPAAARLASRALAATFFLGLGLYLLGWPQLLLPIERLGARLWRRVEPLGRRWLRPRSPLHAVGLGAVWGFLPCGLVYSMLALAATAGGPLAGAAVMAAFGLGTVPALLAAGLASGWLGRVARQTWVRRVAGTAYLAAAVWLAVSLGPALAHAHDGEAAMTNCPLHARPALASPTPPSPPPPASQSPTPAALPAPPPASP